MAGWGQAEAAALPVTCLQQASAASIQKSCFYAIYVYSLDRCHGDEHQTTASDLLAPSAALPAAALR